MEPEQALDRMWNFVSSLRFEGPSANGHITLNTPVLVRSLKLSSVEPSQYLDGWPPGNTGCCWQHIFFWQIILQASRPGGNFSDTSEKFWQIKKPERISLWTNALWLCTFSSNEDSTDAGRQTSRALCPTLKKKLWQISFLVTPRQSQKDKLVWPSVRHWREKNLANKKSRAQSLKRKSSAFLFHNPQADDLSNWQDKSSSQRAESQ